MYLQMYLFNVPQKWKKKNILTEWIQHTKNAMHEMHCYLLLQIYCKRNHQYKTKLVHAYQTTGMVVDCAA